MRVFSFRQASCPASSKPTTRVPLTGKTRGQNLDILPFACHHPSETDQLSGPQAIRPLAGNMTAPEIGPGALLPET